MAYDSVSDRTDLTEAEKAAERDRRRQVRIDWINQDINGLSLQQRVERLEAIVLGQVEPQPGP
jgi:hypothetical protein